MASYPLYSGELAVFNRAKIDQQQADTQREQVYQQFLTQLAKDRTDREGISSRERLGNRGYQSEDFRTTTQGQLGNRRVDAELSLGEKLNALQRLKEMNDLALGEDRNRIAREQIGATTAGQIRDDQTKRLGFTSNETIAKDQLNSMIQQNAANAMAREQFERLHQSLNPMTGRYAGEAGLRQQQMENDQRDALRAQLQSSVNRDNPRGFWHPLSSGPGPKSEFDRMSQLLNAQGYGQKFNVIPDASGYPVLIDRPPGQVNLPPIVPNPPAAQPQSSGGFVKSFLRFTGQDGGSSPSAVNPRRSIPQDPQGNYILYGANGRGYSTPSYDDALGYLQQGYSLTPPSTYQDIPPNQ